MIGAFLWRTELIAVLTTSSSALSPAGSPADGIAVLFWWMVAGAVVIWIGVLALAIYAVRAAPNDARESQAKRLILAGAAIPTVVLASLLAYGLSMLPRVLQPAAPDTLRVLVQGERWWWRIRYQPPGAPSPSRSRQGWTMPPESMR